MEVLVGVAVRVRVGVGVPGMTVIVFVGDTTIKPTQLEGPKVVRATFCTPVGVAVGVLTGVGVTVAVGEK